MMLHVVVVINYFARGQQITEQKKRRGRKMSNQRHYNQSSKYLKFYTTIIFLFQ